MRSFELAHVNALWHADFHVGSRRVLGHDGRWHRVHLLGILDDCSRLGCHVQWYLTEDAERLVHGLSQALQKRGVPRALMTDRGSAETAAELTEGLAAPRYRASADTCLTRPTKTPSRRCSGPRWKVG